MDVIYYEAAIISSMTFTSRTSSIFLNFWTRRDSTLPLIIFQKFCQWVDFYHMKINDNWKMSWLHLYAATVKSLRCNLFEFRLERVQWKAQAVKESFRYRNLGITKGHLNQHSSLDKSLKSPFIVLNYPVEQIGRFILAYQKLLNLSLSVLETYCMASIYVAPEIERGNTI